MPILYEGEEIGEHRLDLFLEKEIVVKLKSVRNFDDIHFSVVKSYFIAAG